MENNIIEFNEFESSLSEFKEQYQGIVYDLEDPEQEKAAKSDKLAIGKVISKLDKVHKVVKADVLARTRLIDGERKRIKDQLLSIQGDIKSQIEEHENKAMKHAAELHNRVEAINALGVFDELPDSKIYQLKAFNKALKDVNAVIVDDSFESREADAALAKMKTIELIEGKIALTEKIIKEEAEAEKKAEEKRIKEQKERDERIRKEAEEKAAKDAKEALERAEREKKEAIEREKLKAEQAVKEAEEKAEKKRLAEIAKKEAEEKEKKKAEEKAKKELEKKQQNQKHRAVIHKDIKNCFIEFGISEKQATEVTTLIKDNKINHVKIEY